jgi:hypothetical protein
MVRVRGDYGRPNPGLMRLELGLQRWRLPSGSYLQQPDRHSAARSAFDCADCASDYRAPANADGPASRNAAMLAPLHLFGLRAVFVAECLPVTTFLAAALKGLIVAAFTGLAARWQRRQRQQRERV